MNMRIVILFLAAAFAVLHAGARPALQPFPRDCTWGDGVVDAAALAVVRDNVRQCEIGASEVPSAGERRIYAGEELGDGIYLAVAGSELAGKLVASFALDVPTKRQGYALVAEKGRIAVVGRDAVGALYGAETLRQLMADGGKVPVVRIRDWPDFAWRGYLSLWGGIRRWGEIAARAKSKLDLPAVKAGFDEMARHKLNTYFSFHSSYSFPTDPNVLAEYREAFAYARERGIRPKITIFESVYTHLNNPKNFKDGSGWDCIFHKTAWAKWWLCWSRDDEFEKMAMWWVKYLKDIGAEDAIIQIHPRDTGGKGGMDPEEFSKRCPKCRNLYGDDERWKATAHTLNIWNRVFKRELPNCSVGSCVQPYLLQRIIKPEGVDDETMRCWKRDTVDYWRQLSVALEDPDFWLAGWACSKQALAEYRKLVPSRPYNFGATYTSNPGVFMTSSRRLGTVYEGVDDQSFVESSTVNGGQWESMFLTGEYMWNTKAAGWEEFDGKVWYDPLVDHTGPRVVMAELLPAICRTFWGENIAPAMTDFFSSGVLPKYLAEPANTIGEWNRIRNNAFYDPTGGAMSGAENRRPPIVDNAELVNGQVAAAEKAFKAIERTRPYLDSLQANKRIYLGFYLRRAPYWLATARVRAAVFAAREALEKGEADGGLSIIAAARGVAERDFAAADANAMALDRRKVWDNRKFMDYGMTLEDARKLLDKAALFAKAGVRIDEAERAEKKARIRDSAGCLSGRVAEFPVAPTATSEVWEGEKVVDRPIVVEGKALFIKPGARVIFRGEGRIEVHGFNLYAANAEFEADGEMTGSFRIYVRRGDIWLDNCRFGNLKCAKSSDWGSGFIRMESNRRKRRPMTVRHCTFVNCSSLSCRDTGDSEISKCRFEGCDTAICALMSLNTVVEGCFIQGFKTVGLELRQADQTEVVGNVFENGPAAAQFSLSRGCRMIGNHYSDCGPCFSTGEGKTKISVRPRIVNE